MENKNKLFSYMTITITFCSFYFASASAANSTSLLVTCNDNVQIEANLVPFDANHSSPIKCFRAWVFADYYLMYQKREANLWSILLSAPSTDAYVGVGFSPIDGRMVGSSTVIGWVRPDGKGEARRYYLRGRRPSECRPDKGEVNLVEEQTRVFRRTNRTYLVFQVNASELETRLVYALGPVGFFPGENKLLVEHAAATSTVVDFGTGVSREVRINNQIQASHRILTILGWGGLVPVGMIMARYGKKWDPLWYYTHIVVQSLGFVLGFIGAVIGFEFEKQVALDITAHKGIGMTITVFGFLQVLAFVFRPVKTSKIRKYWNRYHHNVGRIAIILAVANIFYGLHLAAEQKQWRIGYGLYLGAWLLACSILEVFSVLKK